MNTETFDTLKDNNALEDADIHSTKSGLGEIRKTLDEKSSSETYPIGTLLVDRYTVEKVLGIGGFGIVYECKDLKRNGLSVAVKTLKHNVADYDRAAKRFEREIELSQSLKNKHTVCVSDAGVTKDGTLYFVMELLKGRTLEDYIQCRERFSLYETKQIILQVLESLAEAHDKGIVHRDMKPSNISLEPVEGGAHHEFDVRVLDFGIAKVVDNSIDPEAEKLTQTGAWVGSPAYMSPELLRCAEVSPAADVYAVGLMMLEMVSGHIAVYGSTVMEIAVQQMAPEEHEIDDWICETQFGPIIEKCIRKDVTQRYQTAEELSDALKLTDDTKLKNEYNSAKMRRFNTAARTTSSSRDAGSSVLPGQTPAPAPGISQTGSQASMPATNSVSSLVDFTLTGQVPPEVVKERRILMGVVLGIILLIIIIFVTVFIKLYTDKLFSSVAEDTEKLPMYQQKIIQGATLGAALGAGEQRWIEIKCSFSPEHAKLYLGQDDNIEEEAKCKSGGSFKMIWSRETTIRATVRAERREIPKEKRVDANGNFNPRAPQAEEFEDFKIQFNASPQTITATLAKKMGPPPIGMMGGPGGRGPMPGGPGNPNMPGMQGQIPGQPMMVPVQVPDPNNPGKMTIVMMPVAPMGQQPDMPTAPNSDKQTSTNTAPKKGTSTTTSKSKTDSKKKQKQPALNLAIE